jgi:hypothetical protein
MYMIRVTNTDLTTYMYISPVTRGALHWRSRRRFLGLDLGMSIVFACVIFILLHSLLLIFIPLLSSSHHILLVRKISNALQGKQNKANS